VADGTLLDISAAVTAAAEALEAQDRDNWRGVHRFGAGTAVVFADVAVRAAAPHILEAAGKVIDTEQAERIMQAALDEHVEVIRDAERERIAQFAEKHGARYQASLDPPMTGPFADLIRRYPSGQEVR
jgi:NAD(P)-dependent dehydrogenase (short-subunit alcohol dehydrogenase family)